MKPKKFFHLHLSGLMILLSGCDDSNSSLNENIQEGAYSTANILCELSEDIYNE